MMKDSGASAIQRLLIVKPSSPGDIIHALPVARHLRAAMPNAHIAWLVATNFVNLLEREDSIDEIIPFDRKRYGRFGRSLSASGAFLGFLKQLRARRFDTVLDLQGLFRSGLFTFATGAQRRVGFTDAREMAGLFYNARIDVPDAEIHAVERNLLFLNALGIDSRGAKARSLEPAGAESSDAEAPIDNQDVREGDASTSRDHRLQTGATAQTSEEHRLQTGATAQNSEEHRLQTGATAQTGAIAQTRDTGPTGHSAYAGQAWVDLSIRFDDDDRGKVAEVLQGNGFEAGARYVVLVPATRWETKQWEAARFGKLAARIFERFGLRSVLVGGAGDMTRGAEAVQSSGGGAVNLCGKTTLRQLAALIEGAALVVTADSTPMHIAGAHGVPLVALFGPTSTVRTGPFGREGDVLRLDLDCAPCYLRKLRQCPHQHRCMVDLTVERVFEDVVARLQ